MESIILTKENLTLSNCINGFENYLLHNRKAISTIEAYVMDLKTFKTFLTTKLHNKIRYLKDITRVETEQFKDYLKELVEANILKCNTVYRKFTSLKILFNYLEYAFCIPNILKDDPWGHRNKKADYDKEGTNALPSILEDEDISLLFKTIQNSYDKNKFRDYALFSMLFSLGCRRSEALILKWSDINFLRKEIIIYRPKSKNKSTLKMSKLLCDALLQYKEVCPPTALYVFKSRQSETLSTSAFNAIINKWIKKSGLAMLKSFNITAHTFRHTFITKCIRQDISLSKIIVYTGHSDATSLEFYLHLLAKDLEPIADAFNPTF